MLKINLLPESARKASLSPIEQLHRTPLMWVAAGVLVGIAMLFAVPSYFREAELRQLQAKSQRLEPKKAEVDRLQQYLQQLRAQETAFRSVKRGHGTWSRRLNILSDVIPEGIWFTDFVLDQTKGLVIQGSAIGQGGGETVSVGRLVQELKANPDFASAVKDIQIESIKRIPEGELELVQFTLACTLKDEASSLQ